MVNKNHPNIDHRRPYDHGKSSSLLPLSNLADPHHHYSVNHHHHYTISFQQGHCLPQSLLVSVILLCFVVGISMTLWLWAVALKVLGQSSETSSVEWSKRTEGLLPDGTMNSATEHHVTCYVGPEPFPISLLLEHIATFFGISLPLSSAPLCRSGKLLPLT